MNPPITGGLVILAAVSLAGCLAPMTQHEAQGYAQLSLRRYCAEPHPCGPTRFVKAQRMAPGWLLDYESQTAVYGVMVHDNGIAEVSVWDKNAATAAR